MKTVKKQSVLDRALATKTGIRRQIWIDAVSSEVTHELNDLREAYRRGELSHVSFKTLHGIVVESFGNIVGISAFKDWIKEKSHEKENDR